MPDDINYYIPFVAKGDDAARTVEGYISSPGIDCDDQIVDQDWLKAELPSWLAAFGNIREMHQAKAVGKAKTVDLTTTPGPYLSAKIVDNDAWKKVKEGVYNGFSVGIKSPKIIFDGTAKNGRINGGRLVEVSIVDRPANDAAKFVLVKRAGVNEWKLGDAGPVVEDLQKAAQPALVCQPCGCGPDGAMDGCTCECVICTAAKAAGKAADVDATKAPMTAADQNDLPDSAFAYIEPGGTVKDGKTEPRSKRHYPIHDDAHIRNALSRAAAQIKAGGQPAAIAEKALPAIRRAAKERGIGDDDKEKSMDPEQTPVVADQTAPEDSAEKAAASHVEHRHPFKGTHNHAHLAAPFGSATHTHAHLHNDDDMHDHPHLMGTDARLLSPEEREQGLAMQKASGAYMAADADTAPATADATKAAADFQAAAPAGVNRPAKIGSVEAIIKDAADRIKALAGQMDDGDGDIDTPANEEADGPGDDKTPAADFVASQSGQAVVKPETLSLTFATEADLTKFIDQRVAARLAEQPDFITKAAVSDSLDTIPDIAKLAGGLAKGLEALATKAETSAKELDAMKTAVAETQADLAKVKELAQPVKGAVFAIEKGIGIEPDRIYRDGVIPESATKAAEAARLIAGLSDQERRQVSTAVLTDMYRSRQQS